MSGIAPRFCREPLQTLGLRNFRPPNRPSRRRCLLCCRQSIAEPLAVGRLARSPLEKRNGCKRRRPPDPPIDHSSAAAPAAPKFRSTQLHAVPPHRSAAFRHTAVPLFATPKCRPHQTRPPQHRFENRTSPVRLYLRPSTGLQYRVDLHYWAQDRQGRDHADQRMSRPGHGHDLCPVPLYALTGSGCDLCSSLRTSSRCAPSTAAIPSIVVRVGLPSPRS
jgi:hypothetical protein